MADDLMPRDLLPVRLARPRSRAGAHRLGAILASLAVLSATTIMLGGAGRRFYDDDPIGREPETRDASKVQRWSTSLTYDLALNLFGQPGDRRRVRAQNVNTIDEVPDSSWFTNRIGTRPFSIPEAVQGPLADERGLAPGPLTISSGDSSGVSPKFRLLDSAGRTWFVKFDAPSNPEAASAAETVASKIFHALGYYQLENRIAHFRQEDLRIGEKATVKTPSGKERPFGSRDVEKVLRRALRRADGTYRIVASPAIPGRIIGGFKYYGTRPDDPNDIVPHEHRRELRALQVFAAWTNLVDLKALNTLDTVIMENGRSVVRHYLQDVGSTFGTGALGPREWDEGYEFLYEGDKVWKRLVSFGFYLQPWQTVPYTEYPSIGRFEGEHFDPRTWKSRVPAAALANARADDTFWAARRVAAFSDDMIRAIVKTGQYSDPAAERHLADVLIARRNRIMEVYLPAVNPLVDFAMDASGRLTFMNAAVQAGVAAEPAGGYRATWFLYDNDTDTTTPIGEPQPASPLGTAAPGPLPVTNGAFISIQVRADDAAHPSWNEPVHVYFRRVSGGWTLVGLERLP